MGSGVGPGTTVKGSEGQEQEGHRVSGSETLLK